MDEADIANDLAEKYLRGALAAARLSGGPDRAVDDTRTIYDCIDCGMEIPKARREAVHPLPCERCMACQESAERAG